MNARAIIISAGALLILVAGVIFALLPSGEEDYTVTDNPWVPATSSYDSACDAKCLAGMETVAVMNSPHLKGVSLLARPDVDDAWVQMGQCLDGVLACIDEAEDPMKAPACMAASACPQSCKTAFDGLSEMADNSDKMLNLIEEVFISGDKYCSPARWETSK